MRAPPLRAMVVCVVSALITAGCALTSKSDPINPRYYTPERSGEVTRAGARSSGASPELRLGRVDGASHLEERLVFRESEYELGYYGERRWTEAPDHYLKRRLARVLFEERGIHQVLGGAATTLEVQLTAFEEIRAPKRLARVQVIARLHDQRLVRWEQTLTIDKPVAATRKGDGTAEIVNALGEALRAVVDQIAERVATELAAATAPGATPSSVTN